METKQKTLAIHGILSSYRGFLLAHLPQDKWSSFTSIKCIEYTIVHNNFIIHFSQPKKKKIHHPLYHNFCQAKCTLSAFVAFLFLLMFIVWSQNLELGGVILVVSALYYISN